MDGEDRLNGYFLALLRAIGVAFCLISAIGLARGIRYLAPLQTKENTELASTDDTWMSLSNPDAAANPEPTLEFATEEMDTDGFLRTETILENTPVRENDLFQLAEKYEGISNIPVRLQAPPMLFQNGASKDFWVLNVNTNRYRKAAATLAYQTEHVYFWIEEGIDYTHEHVTALTNTFEEQIYARNRSLFGSESAPGVDNDPHLTILYANDLGGAAGYFSSADSFPPEIEQFSNISEMFYLSAEHIHLSGDYVYGVMAHEFQHMIHWNMDRDEEAWVNEGLSELAVDLNGFDLGGFATLYILNPDLQLNFWPGNEQGSSTPHYGASYLFAKYMYQRFGLDFIKDLVAEPRNGFAGIEKVLNDHGLDAHGGTENAENLFQTWTIANYYNANGRNGYALGYDGPVLGIPIQPEFSYACGDESVSGTVQQFGADYIALACTNDLLLSIDWEETIPVLPVDPYSGKRYFWSNRGDESAMRLSRTFDLSSAENPIILSYWTWYDIERDYDYVYVNISEDGQNWENMITSSCTEDDPTGANYGCGYNGRSNGWIREEVDLSRYARKKITVEFEYITDAAVNGEGLVIDDIRIDALSYFEDFEGKDHGWESDGFVHIKNSLPQYFGVSILHGDQTTEVTQAVQHSPSKLTVPISVESEPVIIILSGLSQNTHQPATYSIRAEKIN